jgi:fused signal recognition particle receptor
LSETPWLDRLRGGFQKTSERLGENLTGLFTKAALDDYTLDEIEEALIASDFGPRGGRVRRRLPRAVRARPQRSRCGVVADEIEKILAPVRGAARDRRIPAAPGDPGPAG